MAQYSPATIANYFLCRASQQGRALTPIQIIKLVYIAHGWHLGFRKEPLINEPVEAWRHGPVIRSLYGKVKKYGSSGITELLRIHLFSSASASKIDPKAAKVLDASGMATVTLAGLNYRR
ncbi:MAG TPA: Panacea domain-containing protein [Xylella sp.]